MAYPAEIKRYGAGGDWVVRFPDLTGANTGAETFELALEEAADCLGSYLAMLIAKRQPIPGPSRISAKLRPIAVPLWIAPKVALHRAMQENRVSNSELARRLGVRETVIRRMLDPDHATKPSRLDAALRALGKRLLVAMDDAA